MRRCLSVSQESSLLSEVDIHQYSLQVSQGRACNALLRAVVALAFEFLNDLIVKLNFHQAPTGKVD